MSSPAFSATGRCTCGEVHYKLNAKPMFVHCCYCTWCQRETGSAFAVNALIETTELTVIKGTVENVDTPSNSGKGQVIVRCPRCKVALWSHYGGAKDKVAFVRAGTLDNPNLCPPDLHIFTSTKQGWLNLGNDIVQLEGFYKKGDYWPEESVKRYNQAVGIK